MIFLTVLQLQTRIEPPFVEINLCGPKSSTVHDVMLDIEIKCISISRVMVKLWQESLTKQFYNQIYVSLTRKYNLIDGNEL